MTLPQSLDIAAVVNLHAEGDSSQPSIISAWRAVEVARQSGLSAHVVLMLDAPTKATTAVAESWRERGAHVVFTEDRDLGAARNTAATSIDATWFAFLDADDLWGEDWLIAAHRSACSVDDSTNLDVWHPQLSVVFGDHHSILHHHDSNDSTFSYARLRLHNGWTALCFIERDNLLATPYPRNRLESGFGYEDWSWNLEVLRRGGRHRVVPHTVHCIRRRASGGPSLLGRSQHALRSHYPEATPGSDRTRHVDRVAGATKAMSAATPVAADLPPTHQHMPVDFSPAVHNQLRLAATIEPAIAATTLASSLPQNTNTHVTAEQQALEELDLLMLGQPATLAEAVGEAARLRSLETHVRATVVAELLLDPALFGCTLGDHPYIRECMERFPQVRSVRLSQ